MKSTTRNRLQAAVITTAVSATAFLPYALATAAADKTIFAPAKIPAPVIGQNTTDASGVVGVTTLYPAPAATGLFETFKAKFISAGQTNQSQGTGVYLGKGLVLTNDAMTPEGARYRVTLADGRSIEAARIRWQDGLMLLRISSNTLNMPEPVKITSKRVPGGTEVAVFGLAELRDGTGRRYVTIMPAYVSSAQAFNYSGIEAPMLAIQVGGVIPGARYSPVFSKPVGGEPRELVGMVVVRADDRSAYVVPADTFVAGVNRNLALN